MGRAGGRREGRSGLGMPPAARSRPGPPGCRAPSFSSRAGGSQAPPPGAPDPGRARPREPADPQGLRSGPSALSFPVRRSLPHSLHFQSASPFKPRRSANPFRAAPLPPPPPPAGCGRPPDFLPFLRLPTRAPRAPPLARPTLTPFPIAAVVCAPSRVLLFRE